jgi:hypothetical protein
MPIQFVLLPLFVEVFLTFAVMFGMAYARFGALKSRQTRIADIALGQSNWPPRAQQVSNNFNSQFQLPVLFYVLTILAIITRHADFLFVVMASIFVLTRLVHSYVHISTNYVPHRFNAFVLGAVVLLAMWIIFAVRILLGLP